MRKLVLFLVLLVSLLSCKKAALNPTLKEVVANTAGSYLSTYYCYNYNTHHYESDPTLVDTIIIKNLSDTALVMYFAKYSSVQEYWDTMRFSGDLEKQQYEFIDVSDNDYFLTINPSFHQINRYFFMSSVLGEVNCKYVIDK